MKLIDDAFTKMDSDCDGAVSWDEYLSYIQLRYTEQDHMYYSAHIRPFPGRCTKVNPQRQNTKIIMTIIIIYGKLNPTFISTGRPNRTTLRRLLNSPPPRVRLVRTHRHIYLANVNLGRFLVGTPGRHEPPVRRLDHTGSIYATHRQDAQ